MDRSTVLGRDSGPLSAGSGMASQRDDWVTVLLGGVMTIGVTLDGWAHKNVIETLEGFFTWWHAVLYTGFLATVAWTFLLAYRRRDRHPRWWWDGWPNGYRVGALGVLVFGAGGVGDMLWHEILGIEIGLLPSFSPSHTLVSIGGLLLVTSPLRSWWASGENGWRAVTGIVSAAMSAIAATVLLTYVSAFMTGAPTVAYAPQLGDYGGIVDTPDEYVAVQGVTAYFITTLLLTIPLILMLRRRAALPGMGTAVTTGVIVYFLAINQLPDVHTLAAVLAIAGAAAADGLLVLLDRRRGTTALLRLPLAGALFPALVWSFQMLGLHLAEGIRWPAEMWTGTVVFTACLGALLGGLATRPAEYGAPAAGRAAADRAPSSAPAA
ncbi:hypothetical protein ACFPZ0_24070 [Streptomonospora nanhaiensis]|uniref:Uncharacterized protein n=1 Tax=Streptomonospora nanhaiensis TaxID=1323731 RepID=A0A853BID9_9ACTN|nr:hypothetical protein [Streptomonospora nanhaiensis]MBV2362908.1 hypothetical protein [Streptomonospora nanhaiensis]MBX9391792.1 hypothetical protein [Streptomonospora nanhaiensis]NYI95268.1 hypothetical protein [Streptomonospora nanhaiensis]